MIHGLRQYSGRHSENAGSIFNAISGSNQHANQHSDATVGQIARYMGWVEEHLSCDTVKGVIVCGTYDKKLDYARKRVRDVEVFLYEVNFSLKEYKK